MSTAQTIPDNLTLLSFSRLTKGNRERLLDALLACGKPVHYGDMDSVVTPQGWVIRIKGARRNPEGSHPTLAQIRREVAAFMAGDYTVKTVSIPSMNAFELISSEDSSNRIILTVLKHSSCN